MHPGEVLREEFMLLLSLSTRPLNRQPAQYASLLPYG
jgi:plasmid maintenance system antidote protein VapI